MGITIGGKMIAKYWKAAIAFLGALLIFLNSIVGIDVWNADTIKWINIVVGFVSAALVFLKRNQQTADSIDTAIQQGDVSVPEVKSVVAKHETGTHEAP